MARTLPRPNVGDGQNRMVLYGAIALAVIAALFAFISLRTLGDDGGSGAATPVDVVVAAQAIGQGEEITADKLRVASLSSDSLIENGLTSLEGVVDVGLVALYPIESGAQVVLGDFGRPSDAPGKIPPVIDHGMRAVSVSVTEEKIFGGLLSPGDRVDVIAIVSRTVGEEDVPTAVTLVQNVEVVAVGEEQIQGIAASDAQGEPDVITTTDEDIESQPDARSVTLEVLPRDVGRVFLAQEEGSIWLAIRSASDTEILPADDSTLFPPGTAGSSGSSGD